MFRFCRVLVLAGIACCGTSAATNAAEPQDVVFTSKLDGTEQRYVVILPEGLKGDSPVSILIALHGHGSDRWQFVKDGRDECRAARDAAAKRGLIYVSPDYRAKTSWMGPAAEADLVQILEDLKRQYRVRKVILCGGSMGGTAALTFAALHPDQIDGVVSMNGTANLVEYTQFQDAISASFGGSKQEKPDEYHKRSAELNADKLTMPIAVTTGGRDTLVPPDSVLRLAAVLQKQNRKIHVNHRPEGPHSTTYADAMLAFDFVMKEVFPDEAAAMKPVLEFGQDPVTIVCLGDSVTGVYYHTGGRRAYPELLEIAIRQQIPPANVKVINAGISGHATAEGLQRLDKDVLSHQPHLVTISFGLNDMVRIPEDQFRANLETLVNRCRAAKSSVVLCTPNAVLTTPGRPMEKLVRYCDIIRTTASSLQVPLCDQFAAGEAIRAADAWGFRCLLSDEIHPNLDGHKRMAEELFRTITGQQVSLAKVTPALPILIRTRQQIENSRPVKILAMPPYDALIGPALKQIAPLVTVEIMPWPTEGKSLRELEQAAQQLVRATRPDLVIIAIPGPATASTVEEFFRSYSWVMNWSLSFGQQEWDCLVVHPSVTEPDRVHPHGDLIRRLVQAQGLMLIDRRKDETADAATILGAGLKAGW